MSDILVITMGGTIDAKPYKVTPPDVIPLEKSIIPKTLEELSLSDKCDVFEYANEDSKDLPVDYPEMIAKYIQEQDADKIIITHGTDILVEAARRMQNALKNSGKTVIITGAMEPIANDAMGEGYTKSDGPDNLKFAFEQVEKQPLGVHIAFHGEVHDPTYTKKDFDAKKFVRVEEAILAKGSQ